VLGRNSRVVVRLLGSELSDSESWSGRFNSLLFFVASAFREDVFDGKWGTAVGTVRGFFL